MKGVLNVLCKSLLCYLLYLVARKVYKAFSAVNYVNKCQDLISIESIKSSHEFGELVRHLKQNDRGPPAFFMFNKYALEMALNWCCNTKKMDGVHERMVFVTFDPEARDTIRKFWPEIRVFHWPIECLKGRFSSGDSEYQVLFLFRTNLGLSLIEHGISFWMGQQDTFWRKNMFELGLEKKGDFDTLFDRMGYDENGGRNSWMNGANLYFRPTESTKTMLEKVSYYVTRFYVVDTGLMIYYCHTDQINCSYVPYKYISGWGEWLYSEQKDAPYLIQMDGEDDTSGKIGQMKKYGFYFLNSDGHSCNETAVRDAQRAMASGQLSVATKSWSKLEHKIYINISEFILNLPWIGPIARKYTILLAYYLILTL